MSAQNIALETSECGVCMAQSARAEEMSTSAHIDHYADPFVAFGRSLTRRSECRASSASML